MTAKIREKLAEIKEKVESGHKLLDVATGKVYMVYPPDTDVLAPISALETALETLEFYQTGFEKRLTDSMMGQYTPALVDRGARADAALARAAVLLGVEEEK